MRFTFLTALLRRFGNRVSLLALLGFGLPWFVFVRLAREVWEGEGLRGDRRILQLLHAHGSPAQETAAVGLSWLGGPVGASVLVGIIALIIWRLKRRRTLLFFGLAVVGAALLNLAAKYLLARMRPALGAALYPEPSYSFPSGHAMAAAALAAALIFLLWRTRWRWLAVTVGLLWVLSISWARLYLGVHYPSDVLAGWVGSVGWVSGLQLLFARHVRGWPGSRSRGDA